MIVPILCECAPQSDHIILQDSSGPEPGPLQADPELTLIPPPNKNFPTDRDSTSCFQCQLLNKTYTRSHWGSSPPLHSLLRGCPCSSLYRQDPSQVRCPSHPTADPLLLPPRQRTILRGRFITPRPLLLGGLHLGRILHFGSPPRRGNHTSAVAGSARAGGGRLGGLGRPAADGKPERQFRSVIDTVIRIVLISQRPCAVDNLGFYHKQPGWIQDDPTHLQLSFSASFLVPPSLPWEERP